MLIVLRHLLAMLRRSRIGAAGAIALGACFGASPHPAAAQAVTAQSADALQAAFLFNFAKFTTWPAINEFDNSIRFCIQEETISPAAFSDWGSKRIHNRPVSVTFFNESDAVNLGLCSILFLGERSNVTNMSMYADMAREQSILLVSDIQGISTKGGHIELFMANRRLRFKVNLAALNDADLTLSANLLNLAEIVDMERRGQ